MEKPTIEEHIKIIRGLFKLTIVQIGSRCPYIGTSYDFDYGNSVDQDFFEKTVCPVCRNFIGMHDFFDGYTCPCASFGVKKAIELTKVKIARFETLKKQRIYRKRISKE